MEGVCVWGVGGVRGVSVEDRTTTTKKKKNEGNDPVRGALRENCSVCVFREEKKKKKVNV